MPLVPFLLYSSVGALIWNAALIWGGAALGARWGEVQTYLAPFETILLAIVLPALVLLGAWRLGLLTRIRERW
ncbi:MAG: DedA family protein, partial [Candidatus Limnocylindrus sp.]